MKKIAFILSLLVFSGGFTSAQAAEICNEVCKLQKMEKERNDANEKANNEYRTNVSNIDNNYLPKISLAESEYSLALSKWREIDQVKITNDSIRVSKIDVTFFNSRFGFITIALSSQDQNNHPGPPKRILGKIISGTTACCAFGSIPGGRDSVYELVAPNFDAAYQEFNWDLEQEYSTSWHTSTAAQAISAFQQGWMWSVRQDGTPVSISEFDLKRSLVKSKYENWKSLQNQRMTVLASAGDEINHLRQAANEIYAGSLSEIQWVQYANLELKSNFPATAKNILTKKGYFKPLKTKSYTYETGTYIAEATISGNTATVTGYWETKTVYDVPTKKEQADWMKKSQKLYDSMIKKYNDIVYEAKSKQYNVVCAKNTPCKVYF